MKKMRSKKMKKICENCRFFVKTEKNEIVVCAIKKKFIYATKSACKKFKKI